MDQQETGIQQTDLQEIDHSKSSKQISTSERNLEDEGADGRRRVYSAKIAQMMRDFSRLFHDQEHEHSNRTRALRLWTRSGLDEDTFAELLYDARGVAQRKGNIARAATDGSPQGAKNRMPYFFSVLEGLIDETVEAVDET